MERAHPFEHPSVPFHRRSEQLPTKSRKNVHPLRSRWDHSLISTWENKVLPALPNILDERIGQDYSACVIREETSPGRMKPCIEIVSAYGCSDQVKIKIKEDIKELLAPTVTNVGVRFSTGKLRLLAHFSLEDEPSSDEASGSVSESSADEGSRQFPAHKRYWHKAGLSASIGLLATRRVSATLGGLLLVDGQLCILTVDHFLDESRLQRDRAESLEADAMTITSPSLSDVYEVRLDLTQHIRDLRVSIGEHPAWKDRDQSASGWKATAEEFAELNELMHEHEQILALYREVDKPDWEFEIGRLVYRSGWTTRSSVGSQFVPGSCSGPVGAPVCMDWSLFSVKAGREGLNCPRYQYDDENRVISDATPDDILQAEQLTTSTCDIDPCVPVHYIGRSSGKRCGLVSPTRMLVDREGTKTWEWFMCPSDGEFPVEAVAGDSGAWVVRDTDNAVTAQVFAWQRGKLLISPINDIIADVKRVANTPRVSLPFAGGPVPAAEPAAVYDGFLHVHEVKKVSRKPMRYNASSLPKIAIRKTLGPADFVFPHVLEPVPAHTGSTIIIQPKQVRDQKQDTLSPHADSGTPPMSPVPSLEASSSASPGHTPRNLSSSSLAEASPSPCPSPTVKIVETGCPPGLPGPRPDSGNDKQDGAGMAKTSLSFVVEPWPVKKANHNNENDAAIGAEAKKRSATMPIFPGPRSLFLGPKRSLTLPKPRRFAWDMKAPVLHEPSFLRLTI